MSAPEQPTPSQYRRHWLSAEQLGLLLAIAAGAFLRFNGLTHRELSADEANSWAAAAVPTVSKVVELQAVLNPGKLPLHDLLLHFWITVFGDGVFSMRFLSALMGTMAIPAVYFAGKLLFQELHPLFTDSRESRLSPACLGTLLFSVNLVTIKYAQEARMYSLVLLAALAQVIIFLRMYLAPKGALFCLLVILTGLCAAANFSALLVFAAEAAFLASEVLSGRTRSYVGSAKRVALLLGSLGLGTLVFLAFSVEALQTSRRAIEGGVLSWIKPPKFWEPIALFNKATGTFAFPVIALAATIGVLKNKRWRSVSVRFLLFWMWAPVIALFSASLVAMPLLVERYVLSSFVPFILLAGLGIHTIVRPGPRAGFLALALTLSIGHWYSYGLKPHDAQWREASYFAERLTSSFQTVAVAPAHAVNVVRYYTAPALRASIVPAQDEKPAARILILGDQGVSNSERARLERLYPYAALVLRGVEVRLRDQD